MMKFISEILLVRVRRKPFSFKQLWLFSVVHVNVIAETALQSETD